jgi:hypothetical protein
MIEGLKRAVGKSAEQDWALNDPVVEDSIEEVEQESDSIEVPAQTEATFQPSGHDSDYYVSLIRASLLMKGRFGNQSIPEHWLRMTLSGLEGKHVAVQSMWDTSKSDNQLQQEESLQRPEHSGNDDVFQPGWEGALEAAPSSP